jgi:ABC-type transport system involved in multi-copper enzyme maturation permease subunit
LTIIPIFRREMVAAARLGKLQSMRVALAGQLFLLFVGVLGAWYYWADGVLDSATMGRVVTECLRWGVILHAGGFGMMVLFGARSIAKERDSRTLDFLLVTRMHAAEIILAKLASCLLLVLTWMAAGFPMMVLIHVLGGIDLRVILLAYAGFACVSLFVNALAIWISTEIADSRSAAVLFLLAAMAWVIGPFWISVFLPRLGIHLPEWLAFVNAQLLASSPLSVAFPLISGSLLWSQLVYLVSRMASLQLAGTVLFTVAAIVRLRPAHRALAGVDRRTARRARRRLVWRLRPRPPVGDDPIYWREKCTSRQNGLVKALGVLIFGGLVIGLAVATVYYTGPAFAELWRYGYGSSKNTALDPDANILLRLFLPTPGPGGPIDQARTDFNIFIRFVSVLIVLTVSFVLGGISSEVIGIERMKDTWSGVLATSLGADEIVGSAMRVALWRSRGAYSPVFVLWTLGVISGAIHPLGYVVSMLALAASVWLLTNCGVLGSIQATRAENSAAQGVTVPTLLIFTGVLPLLLPVGLNSVLWAVGSTPMIVWTSLVSCGEFSRAVADPLNPRYLWYGQLGGQMPLLVFASWLISIVGAALAGLWVRRYTLAHFDRLVGRPFRRAEATELPVRSQPPARSAGRPAAAIPLRGSPLAEADGAV